MPYVRRATSADAEALAGRMRQEDIAEAKALSGRTPYEALVLGLRNSDIPLVIAADDDTPIAMFGAGPIPGEPLAGFIWMLASEDLVKIQRRFLRECREWVDAIQTRYPILTNVVDERNAVHITWLRWLGCVFIRRHPRLGVEGRPFIEFVRIQRKPTHV